MDLSDNKLRRIPDWIGNLTNLTYLNLSDNKLGGIPDSIRNLTKLKNVNLRSNQFLNVDGLKLWFDEFDGFDGEFSLSHDDQNYGYEGYGYYNGD